MSPETEKQTVVDQYKFLNAIVCNKKLIFSPQRVVVAPRVITLPLIR